MPHASAVITLHRMTNRRDFLVASAATTLFARPLLAAAGEVGSTEPTMGKVVAGTTFANPPGGRFKPLTRIGLGGVAIGNGFAPANEEQCFETLEAAWAAGVRYYDTSPFYGFGLSERRFGAYLHGQKRSDYTLSTKVGRVFTAGPEQDKAGIWMKPSPFKFTYDYTAEGVRRSIEDSLQRLGVSSLDIVFVHDLSPDNQDMGNKWTEHFAIAAKGAFPELTKMRNEGIIKAWGLGVNRPDPALKTIEVADPDIFLLATQYSMLEHQNALAKTLPALAKKGISVVVGAPLNAGYLAGRDRYDYSGTVPTGVPQKRTRMQAIATKHGIDLRTAALQFCAAHPAVSSVIPGARTAEQVKANVQSMQVAIPNAFWDELKGEKLIAKDAPVPRVVG